MTGGAVIRELAIPETMESPGAEDFSAAIEVHTTCESLGYGSTELAMAPAEVLIGYQDQEHQPTRLFVARVDGRIIGQARYETDASDEPDTAWIDIDVLPEFRGRGIGDALSARLQGVAATDGIRKSIVYAVFPEGPGPRIAAPTGFGSIAAGSPGARFLVRHGYRLEQVVRASRLALPIGAESAALALTRAKVDSGDDYAIHSWIDVTPQRWVSDMALLYTRMSTEEPSAGLEEPEDAWTVERLLADESRRRNDPRSHLVVAVEHVPSGRLVGFTALYSPRDRGRAVSQSDTLVPPEHRGHRLGMLLKVANLAHLQRERPGHPAVITFNAEENRHMLDVNETIGFVPIGYEGAWRKDLPG